MTAPMLQAALAALRGGGVVAYPTEGVWGVGCDPRNAAAVAKVIALKQRDWHKGLILLAADFEMLRPFVTVPSAAALAQAQATWPGPVTWVFPAGPACLPLVRGEHPSIAVRVTAHPLAAALSRAFGAPVVSTSANLAGHPAALTAADVRAQLGSGVDAIVDGPLGGLKGPTAIRDIATGDYIRRPAGN
ncbi:MAG: tRNA threonylcarbamoyladenosine biosynthesis protein RimN [Nevskiaceae bacterium]|nr:MAG: tRNA threonylcarbamoyladenosine biosynthesis protein RimN [Nevskiaceae bacterium]TBR72577.1 MAG: tRNA threonylcarbamoyladenosine biosynthesis protein RimN [Nevskiaceae bacterium]